jgi:hypothetical protein
MRLKRKFNLNYMGLKYLIDEYSFQDACKLNK